MSLSLYCEDDDDNEENLCCNPCYRQTFHTSRCAPACKWLKQVNEHNDCANCCCEEKYDCYDDCRNCLISCCPHTWKCCPADPPCWKPPPPRCPRKPVWGKPTACCKKTVKIKPCPNPSVCSVICKLSESGTGCDSLKGVVAVLFVMIVIIISFYINSKLPTERKTCCCIANLFK